MPAERYYINQEFHHGNFVSLEGTEYHHLRQVMRSKIGDRIELVNGMGSLAIGKVDLYEKHYASIVIEEIQKQEISPKEIILIQAIPRINRLDTIVEKGTELGMTQLWLFPAALSERKELNEHQLQRLNSIAIAAMKQCGRLYLPIVKVILPPSDWKKMNYPAYFGDLKPSAPTLLNCIDTKAAGTIFVTGPESGFTDEEEEQLNRLKIMGVKLHPNILRTDTASIVALSLISQIAGQ
jgi:16S rRNA (uracil1498-N3)-methyltransferase